MVPGRRLSKETFGRTIEKIVEADISDEQQINSRKIITKKNTFVSLTPTMMRVI